MERIPRPGEFYRHFKNKLYQVLAVAEHTETGERLVIYQALYGDFRVYARPLAMFVSPVDRKKYPDVQQEYRFEQVRPGENADCCEIKEKEEEEKEYGQKEVREDMSFLLEFLDGETPEKQLAVLKKKGGQASLRQLEMLCESLEISSGQGDRESALAAVRAYLETRIRYDGSRLRR